MNFFSLESQADTIFAPHPVDLNFRVQRDVYVKLRGGAERKEYFWVKVTQRDGDNLFGMVASPLHVADGMGRPYVGSVIAFTMLHICSDPILWPPVGMKVCEIQLCGMHNDEDGGRLAASEVGLEVNGYDVLIRYCDVNDNPEEPSDILHYDDFSFDDYNDAGIFADWLCDKYTPDMGVEEI